jgi:hypothetical protein
VAWLEDVLGVISAVLNSHRSKDAAHWLTIFRGIFSEPEANALISNNYFIRCMFCAEMIGTQSRHSERTGRHKLLEL